jgi:hypothetical protein
MSQDVTRLEELLARVQKNAALPRASRLALAPAPAAAPPAAYSSPPPAVVAPPPAVFSPPVAAYSPPAPVYAPPPPPTFTDSVDDLLADPFPASSAPPPPPPVDVIEDPMPYVAAASPAEHISGVMPVAEVSDEAPEELFEDDIVEMSPVAAAAAVTETVEAVVPAGRTSLDDVDLNFDEEEDAPAAQSSLDDEPPASSSRNRIAGTMDEALARAAEQMEIQEGREVPLKTPPPESGPQAAMAPLPAGIHAPPAPDLDELLEADILPTHSSGHAVPTTEQLGQTIDLEEARGPHLELDHPAAAAPIAAEASSEELEVTLPQREFGGGYQDDLMPPPEARQDLDAHLQRVGDDASPPPPESLGQYPSMQPSANASGMFAVPSGPSVTTESPSAAVSTVTIEAPANAEFSPELLARPDINPVPVAKFVRADAPRPNTFLELLDASLTLGRD